MRKGFAHHTELEDMNALKSAEDTTTELEDMNALKSVKDTTTFPSEDFDENKSDEPNASDETEDNWNDWLSYQEGITRNWVDALAKKSDIIASELVDLFLSAFADTEFLISQDWLDYSLAVMREIMSDRGLDIMATTFKRITSTVENVDDIHISPDYTIMAEVLGGKVQLSLPRLMEVLRDDSVPYDIIAAIDEELSPVFENQLWANLQVLVEDFLEFLKTEALVALGSLKNPDDSDEDLDSFTSDSDELSSLEDFSTQLGSTPYKNQGDKMQVRLMNSMKEQQTQEWAHLVSCTPVPRPKLLYVKSLNLTLLSANWMMRQAARTKQCQVMKIQVRLKISMKMLQIQEWAPLVFLPPVSRSRILNAK